MKRPMKEMPHRQLLSDSRGRSCGWRTGRTTWDRTGNFQSGLSGDEELPEHFQLANGESQEDGLKSWPADTATGPVKKMPHRGRVTVRPSPRMPCGLGFVVSNFRARPGQRRFRPITPI
jgi:hypothetical protein